MSAEPWYHDKEEFADWGWIRSRSGPELIAIVKPPTSDPSVLDEHRRNGTDPTEATTSRIISCVNACAGLADPEKEIARLRDFADQFKAECERLRGNNTTLVGLACSLRDEIATLREKASRLGGITDLQSRMLDGAIHDSASDEKELATLRDENAKLRAIFAAAKALSIARKRWDTAMNAGDSNAVDEADEVETAAMRELMNAVEEAEGRAA